MLMCKVNFVMIKTLLNCEAISVMMFKTRINVWRKEDDLCSFFLFYLILCLENLDNVELSGNSVTTPKN